ncbi:dihydrofolate reductase family protein [Edaphobacter flagellatus]|uniref:dihydrofolate reductase family protein n=1 Tax=Edaphobacter flagellatus TaxID=1933044 RepID=UPI0021B2912A|nr:dihydrofolate reductase family protein [Edaphobacter flagellatus]
MRKLYAFLHLSADGYFTGPHGDLSWTRHDQDPEYKQFADDNARRESVLVFGRITYQMMAGFWPSPMALEREPVMAARMNAAAKLVFSRSLPEASWSNTTLVKDNIVDEMRRLKQQPGPDLTILGSGSLVRQFAEAGVLDEFQLLITPVVIGGGRTLFEGVTRRLDLDHVSTRTFQNGKVLLIYKPTEPK